MKKIAAVSALVLSLTPAGAQSQNQKPVNLKKSVVSDQEIQIDYFYNLALDCKPYGEIRIAVLSQPKNGTLSIRKFDVLPNFRAGSTRVGCNKEKTEAIAPYYQAKPGYRGADKLKFAVVYHDGEARIHDVDITVWGP